MKQSEIDLERSAHIANSVVEELVRGKVLAESDWARAEAIAAQQIHVHLISQDRPDTSNRRYQPGGICYRPSN
jgi:hypothetical protein